MWRNYRRRRPTVKLGGITCRSIVLLTKQTNKRMTQTVCHSCDDNVGNALNDDTNRRDNKTIVTGRPT